MKAAPRSCKKKSHLTVMANLVTILRHPFSLIITAPSLSGKSTLAYNIIKSSNRIVENTNGLGFDSVWIIYKSYQPLYKNMQETLSFPVRFLAQNTDAEDLETQIQNSSTKYPVIVIDDGLSSDNSNLVSELFTRLAHHLSLSVILICQSLFDQKNPTLRICHRNTKALIIFACPRDISMLRSLIHQMIICKKRARTILQSLEKELQEPYRYIMIDFQIFCPSEQRFKMNILCEKEAFPIVLALEPAQPGWSRGAARSRSSPGEDLEKNQY